MGGGGGGSAWGEWGGEPRPLEDRGLEVREWFREEGPIVRGREGTGGGGWRGEDRVRKVGGLRCRGSQWCVRKIPKVGELQVLGPIAGDGAGSQGWSRDHKGTWPHTRGQRLETKRDKGGQGLRCRCRSRCDRHVGEVQGRE